MRLYQQGASGEAVSDIQLRLSSLGWPCDPDPPGEYEQATASAVSEFQRSKGLIVDGIVGPETWRVLVESGYRLGDRLLYNRLPMMRGDDVADLQKALNALGFEAGKADGIFGPDTQTGLLDFQRNRGLAEDGICGPRVSGELELVDRATHKEGREGVREREWLRHLPDSVAGRRLFVDPFCRDDIEALHSWEAASACARELQEHGAIAVLSRSADARPPERVRARRANRLGVDLVIAFATPTDGPGVFFFESERSRSDAGEQLASRIASRLGVGISGLAIPILRETRPVAVVVAVPDSGPKTGMEVALGVEALFLNPPTP
jgi:N-acetylmuramoyl-L-alanine amidase